MNGRWQKQMPDYLISANENGDLVFIHDDDLVELLSGLGPTVTTRASHVEPGPDGKWYADMSPVSGPQLGPFDRRREAIDEEVEWIKENVL